MPVSLDRPSEPRPLDLGFDPGDLDFVADPYPAYERLRALAPIVYDEVTDHWLVTRFHDVNALLRDRRLGRTYLHRSTHEDMGREPPSPTLDPFWHLITHGILDMEPPDHTRVRRLVSKAFTPRMVESMREPVQRLTDDLVDQVAGAGELDLLPTIAEPLPVAVIAELLGVPSTDRHLL
ncbi:MAG: cytochrome P450, partial [Actinomycetota bacterium]|nr:cytochrome P450 [Actinomycetota bacterium]